MDITRDLQETVQNIEIKKILQEKREEILKIAARYGASNVRIFGSVARGEATADSDIDFLMDIQSGYSLLNQFVKSYCFNSRFRRFIRAQS